MKRYAITYHCMDGVDVDVLFYANTEDEAIIFAKHYRKDPFSIKEITEEDD